MTDEAENKSAAASPVAARTKTFFKGVVYYDHRRVSIDCTIRDISESGARLAFATTVNIPDSIELYIPQKQRTLLAVVRRREQNEIGVSFEDQRSGEPRRTADGDLADRVARLEQELSAIKRVLKKLKAEVLPDDSDI